MYTSDVVLVYVHAIRNPSLIFNWKHVIAIKIFIMYGNYTYRISVYTPLMGAYAFDSQANLCL